MPWARARVRVLLARASFAHDYGAGGAALFDIVNVQNWTRRRISGPLKHARFRTGRGAAVLLSIFRAGLAHREEHSPCKREAGGSSPPASTTRTQRRNRPVQGTALVGGNRRSIRRCGTIDALVAKRQTQPPQKRPPSRHGGSSPPGCTSTLLASPSGQGIGPTHRHSQVRVLERAPTASLA